MCVHYHSLACVHDETTSHTYNHRHSNVSYNWCDTQFTLFVSAGQCDPKDHGRQDKWVYTRVPGPHSHTGLCTTGSSANELTPGWSTWCWLVLVMAGDIGLFYLCVGWSLFLNGHLLQIHYVHKYVDFYVYIITYAHTRICPLVVSATSHSRRARLHGRGYLWWIQFSDKSLDPMHMSHTYRPQTQLFSTMSSVSHRGSPWHTHTRAHTHTHTHTLKCDLTQDVVLFRWGLCERAEEHVVTADPKGNL